jgi:hypothetical protein
MSDRSVQERIEELVEEEQRLMSTGGSGEGPDPERHKREEEQKIELDRFWDQLRQRRAREEFGLDPDDASARPAETVEHYEQ